MGGTLRFGSPANAGANVLEPYRYRLIALPASPKTQMRRTDPSGTISLLLPDLRGGGVERVRILLAQEFLARGYKVDFVLLRCQGDLVGSVPRGARVVDLGVHRLRYLPKPLIAYLRKERPRALLAAMWPVTSLAAISCYLAGSQTRVVISEHTTLSRAYATYGRLYLLGMKFCLAATYRLADERVGVSAGVVADLASLAAIAPERFKIVHNPVYLSQDQPILEEAERVWGTSGGKRILTVSNLKPAKNHALLIRAFARLLRSIDATLMLIGDGPLREELKRLARAEGVANRVVMPGFISDPKPFYLTADLFVLSSQYEGFGNVIVEALSCGLPVVSTDCPGGPAEILDHGRFGRLVPIDDVDALANAMAEALTTPTDRELLRQRAADFSPDKVAEKYLQLLFPDS